MNESDNKKHDADVLVLGAGMAGLAAARALATKGLRVLVLEAENRVGGRIFTRHIENEVVELGAEFVHGRPPELLALINEAGLALVEREGSAVRFRNGELRSDEGDNDGNGDSSDDPFAVLEGLKEYSGEDKSFAEFLATKELSEEARTGAIGFVEGFNAADHKVISIAALGVQQAAEDAIEGDRAFHVRGGYDQLPRYLAAKLKEAGGEVLLNTRVRRLQWQEGEVIAVAGTGEDVRIYSAPRVLVALPLGVLQQGEPEFIPSLPESIRDILVADAPIRTGHAVRFTVIFRERFWGNLRPQPALGELSFLFTPESVPPVWWTPHPESSNAITGWIGGPRTSVLNGQDTEVLAEQASQVLAAAFGLDVTYVRSLVLGCHIHDWSADPSAMGAYSFIAKGGLDASGKFAEAIAETIYFAGEHTTTDGHWGTVHAALGSGLRAAAQISSTHTANDAAG
jgi:monoamine oxidase